MVHVALPAGVCKSGYPVQQVCIAAPLQQQWSSIVLGSLFSDLSNCSVNISPQNFVVNVNHLLNLMHQMLIAFWMAL